MQVADPDGVAREIVFVAPSLTPRKRINPSARIYELDKDSYELLNYRQYYMDLDAVVGKDLFAAGFAEGIVQGKKKHRHAHLTTALATSSSF